MKERPSIPYKVSHKKTLPAEVKIIQCLREDQPLKVDELCKKARISRTTFYHVRPVLINEGIIKETEKGRYALADYDMLSEKVEEAFRKFKENRYVQVSLIDIANEVGEPIESIKTHAFHYARKYGLKIGEESKEEEPEPFARVIRP